MVTSDSHNKHQDARETQTPGFRKAAHKPMGDITVAPSIIHTALSQNPQEDTVTGVP